MTHSGTGGAMGGPSDNVLERALHEIVARWRSLVGFPVAAAVLAIAVSFLVKKEYDGVAVFAPSQDLTNSLSGNLSAIASQFGIGANLQGYSVYYFAQVLQSREVFRQVATDTLLVDNKRYPVLDLVDASGDSLADRIDDAIKTLDDQSTARTDDQSNLVTFHVRGPTPELATALCKSFLVALDSATNRSLQFGGSAQRRFAEAQADSARVALRQAEDSLAAFYRANRDITSSPTLQAEDSRLRRQVQIHQDVYVQLVGQEESAKLREVNNTPTISMIQPPQASTEKVWPKRGVWALFALLGAIIVSGGWIYVLEPVLPDSLRTRLYHLVARRAQQQG